MICQLCLPLVLKPGYRSQHDTASTDLRTTPFNPALIYCHLLLYRSNDYAQQQEVVGIQPVSRWAITNRPMQMVPATTAGDISTGSASDYHQRPATSRTLTITCSSALQTKPYFNLTLVAATLTPKSISHTSEFHGVWRRESRATR